MPAVIKSASRPLATGLIPALAMSTQVTPKVTSGNCHCPRSLSSSVRYQPLRLIAAGVNLVVPAHASIAHAEMIALTLAQQRLGTHDLSETGCELATSTEPCAMCLGAIPWSGVTRLLCGARDEDARAVGFDEGAKPANWVQELTSRGIEVVRDVLRDEARAVLRDYKQSGGTIYNPRR